MGSLPVLDGVRHQFVEVGDGVTIHVADAGPTDGPPVNCNLPDQFGIT